MPRWGRGICRDFVRDFFMDGCSVGNRGVATEEVLQDVATSGEKT